MFKNKEFKPILLKVIIGGDGGVGKTTLLHRYIESVFLADTHLTIGVEFFLKEIQIDETKILLQVWDFGGQERFRPLLISYATGARGALLLFDLTRPSSLNRIDQWVNICRQNNQDIPILLLGSKLDLIDAITIDDDFATKFIDEYNFFNYLKISSKTGENVNLAFELLAKELIKDL